MVKVCDAIMGSGKTSAAIAYINAHPEKRFIYITPYLPEAARIREGCPEANFQEPNDKLPQYGFSKSRHTLALIEEGRNIASTHAATLYYTEDTIRSMREQNYTMIIDEEVTVLQKDIHISYSDAELAKEAGYIEEIRPDEYALTEKADGYRGGKLSHMFRVMRSRNLVCTKKGNRVSVFYWIYPERIFRELEDVIVLTYLFPGSEMESFFHMNGIGFTYIGISHPPGGGYAFSDRPDYVPEYVSRLGEMITIEGSERMNRIGNARTALSMNWYKDDTDGRTEQLRRNLYNYFRARAGDCGPGERMCGTFKSYWGKIRAKGYWNSDVVFSQKASNEFRDRTVLAYPVNLFASGDTVRFYAEHGEDFDNDRYALAIMLQWIWRSAIRDGKPIRIYIPSRRMRELLTDWIDNIKDGGQNEQAA